jgi:hypothetical protein
MPRHDIEDEVCLRVPVAGAEDETRWWSITQPPPSVAFALQASIADALGGAADMAIRLMLRVMDPETEAAVDATEKTLGESAALAVFRNARSGQALCPEFVEYTDGTKRESYINDATDRLRSVLAFVGGNLGVRLSAARLVGVPERDKDNMAFRWREPALLHQLLLYSGLRFGGTGKRPAYSAGKHDATHPGTALYDATNTGNVSKFMGALDGIVASPDELGLLCAWAVVHLWRPF